MEPADSREGVLFREARQRPKGPEREAYLDQACAGNEALRNRLAALLQADESPDPFLEPQVGDLPGQIATRPTPNVAVEEAGARIGRYKLLEKIGEGGCGVVYMAEQEEPIRRRVAFKVIKLGMDTKQVIARFESERQALALMDHPNIAKVLDAGATDTGRPYFVMELVRGIKITDYCDQNHLSTEERLNLFVQICHAIQHAHQKGIIHRDIKPSNILVTLHDGVPVPKVIDFGIAKATGQRLTDKTLFTAFQQFVGTPAYMSPEQAEMSGLDIDTRSDIYALGVLLYELLTGQTPFEQKALVAAGLDEMRRIIREQEPVRPSTRLGALADPERTTVAKRRGADPPQLIHRLRGDLDWIVMKALEKDRARRYEAANGLADDIMRHLHSEPIAARPPNRLYRFQKLVRRNKLVFAAAFAVAAALVIGLGSSTWLYLREQLALERAVAAEKTQRQLRQQAQAEAKKSEQVAQLLKEMLQGVGPSVALGRDTTMLKEILDKYAERVGKDLKGQPEVEAELRSTIGGVYDALGQYQKAEAMHRLALTLRKELWGNSNTKVADSLDSLGWELLMQDKVDAAEPCFQEALAIRTKLLGSENVKVAASLYHLGCVGLFQAGSEAERFFRQSLAMRRRLLGNESADVAESLSGLSSALCEAGQPDQAEAAARESLAIQARLAPDERSAVDAAMTQARLGGALRDQKKFAEAEPVVRQAVTLLRNLLGTENYYFAAALDALAEVLLGEDKLAEAETVAREALATSRRALGEQSFTTAYSLSHLGMILHKTGRLAEAEAAFREALEIGHQLGNLKGGSATINAVWTCGMLAEVLQERGRAPEAEALYRAEVDTVRKSPSAWNRANALGDLGDWLREQGKPGEAEPLYRESLDIYLKIAPDNFRGRQWLARGLALTLVSQGKLGEAEALYRETIEAGRSSSHTNDLAILLTGLGDLLRDQGKLAEAEPLYREGLDICLKVSPDKFDVRQWLAGDLALTLQRQGKLAEAEPLYREAMTNAAKVWPNDPAKWQWQVSHLAEVLRAEGKSAEAEKLTSEVSKPAALAQPQGTATGSDSQKGGKP